MTFSKYVKDKLPNDYFVDVDYRCTPRQIINAMHEFCNQCVPDYEGCGDNECQLHKYIGIDRTKQRLPKKKDMRNDIRDFCLFCQCLDPHDNLLDCHSKECVLRQKVMLQGNKIENLEVQKFWGEK